MKTSLILKIVGKINLLMVFLLKINQKNYEKYVIVMDNLSCHKTRKKLEFYIKNGINIIYNSPYLSQWNSIELAFRALKRKYYVKLFTSKDELKNYAISILESEEYLKTLTLNFDETLKEYRNFILENSNKNLNNLNNEYN